MKYRAIIELDALTQTEAWDEVLDWCGKPSYDDIKKYIKSGELRVELKKTSIDDYMGEFRKQRLMITLVFVLDVFRLLFYIGCLVGLYFFITNN
jgi:hypothetical protein